MTRINRVLITRHKQAAQKTAIALGDRGYKSEIMPLAKILALDNPMPVSAASQFDGIIITSPVAFDQLHNHSEFEKIRKLPVYCVGKFTAKRAQQTGFETIDKIANDAKKLAEQLAQTSPKSNFLYPCAKNRSFDFVQFLAATGRGCCNWEVYENKRIAPEQEQILTALERTNTVFLFSKRTTEHFFSLTNGLLPVGSRPCHNFVAISQHVASLVPRKWQSTTYIADEKSEKSMIDCLESITC